MTKTSKASGNKKRTKASMTFDMNSGSTDNPDKWKKVDQNRKPDPQPKKPNPPSTETQERGDTDIANLIPAIEGAPLKNLKKFQK